MKMKKRAIILITALVTSLIIKSSGLRGPNEVINSNEVTIGKQVWMSQNLNVDKFRNGDPIPQAKTSAEFKEAGKNEQPAWCYYDSITSVKNGRFVYTTIKRYGKLYNWYAVNDTRGLAPAGWHIPTDLEWTVLTDYLGGDSVAGTQMKSPRGWAKNGNGSNTSGFSGLPGGACDNNGYCEGSGSSGYWWSSSDDEKRWNAIGRGLWDGYNSASKVIASKINGFSVRCIRD